MIQAFDNRSPVIVVPSEIRPGDWMRDLGRLRQVESVEAARDPIVPGALVRFSDDADGQFSTLSVCEGVSVTVWRCLVEAGGASNGV
jgi:hypothetical protein